MFYIKLEDDMSLVITVRDSIYRGDNLNQKIRYLIPLTVGDVDVLTAFIYLNYIRADGTPDVVRLERLEEKYNESYYQYVFPVTSRLTKYPGEVCTWMQICSGPPSCPVVSKSGECVLQIEESKNMDDYICDHQLTALYRLEKSLTSDIEEINELVAAKADSLSYNEESRELRLKSGDIEIGEAVIVPANSYPEGGDINWGDIGDPEDEPEFEDNILWEPM